MAQIYFSKFNISSEIYNVYKDDNIRLKLLDDIFNKMDTDAVIEEQEEKEENDFQEKGTKLYRYKFCNLVKDYDNKTVTGRLVKIYNGEVQSYNEVEDTIEFEEMDDCASSCTFHFDVMNEQIAFITRNNFGYRQFNHFFQELIETYFQNISFEIFLEKNIDDLKRKIYGFSKILSFEIVIIPPNASDEDFEVLFGTSKKDIEESNATKYTQRLDVSNKNPNGINPKTSFFDRMFYGVAKGYGQIIARGKNQYNQTVTVNSDEDAPYRRPIPDNEKDSITAFSERAHDYILELIARKMELSLNEENSNNENREN